MDTRTQASVPTPIEDFFRDNREIRQEAKTAAKKRVRGAETVVIGDGDADGYGALTAVRAVKGWDTPFIACGYHGGYLHFTDALEIVSEEAQDNADVIVQDLRLDELWKVEDLERVPASMNILWFDHHEWDEKMYSYVQEHTDYLEVDTGTDNPDEDKYNARCAAQMVRDYFQQSAEYSETINEAIDVTAEYDLWRLRDERCHDLSDYASIVESPDEYVEALKQYGADILESTSIREEVEQYRKNQKALKEYIISNADVTSINGLDVAIAYGSGPTNDIAEELRSDYGVGLVCVVYPNGSCSFRSNESQFEKCHLLAEEFGGGGHAAAAGGSFSHLDSPLEYAEHWCSQGSEARDILKHTVRDFLERQNT